MEGLEIKTRGICLHKNKEEKVKGIKKKKKYWELTRWGKCARDENGVREWG